MKQTNNNFKPGNPITSIVLITTLLSCGLMIPVWLLIGLVILIVNKFVPKPPVIIPQYKVIPPSNEFASDWDFRIRSLAEVEASTDVDD